MGDVQPLLRTAAKFYEGMSGAELQHVNDLAQAAPHAYEFMLDKVLNGPAWVNPALRTVLPAAKYGQVGVAIANSAPAKHVINTGLEAASRGAAAWNRVAPKWMNPFGDRAHQAIQDVQHGVAILQNHADGLQALMQAASRNHNVDDLLRSVAHDPDMAAMREQMNRPGVTRNLQLTMDTLHSIASKRAAAHPS